MGEEIIKEDMIQCNGGFFPFTNPFNGYIKLTKEKLIIEYYLFSILFDKIYGTWKRKIEIPFRTIESIANVDVRFMSVRASSEIADAEHHSSVLKIVYMDKSKTKAIYLNPFKIFTINPLFPIQKANEWVEVVNKLKNH